MKLLRYGPAGQEKPGLLDASGTIRDLSGVIPDLAGEALSAAGLAKLAALDPASLPAVAGNPRIGPPTSGMKNLICIGLNYADHAAETGAPVPKEPIVFLKSLGALCGPNDDVIIPKGSVKSDWEVELCIIIGTKAKCVSRGPGAGPCRRLCGGQRRLRARMADRARRRLGQGQGLRHLRPGRPLAGDQGRGAGPAEPDHVLRRGRPAHAGWLAPGR